MHRVDRRDAGPVTLVGAGLSLTTVMVLGLLSFTNGRSYDTWGAILVGPILFALALPACARQAAREGDRRVLWLLVLALALRMAGAVTRNYLELGAYGGKADSAAYNVTGLAIAQRFRAGNFSTGLNSLTSGNFIRFATGIVYTIMGPSELGAFLVFASLNFWGVYFFYRAFVVAVPEGVSRSYARLIFFLPSLLIWPSGIGKDGWMIFALGIGAFGAARVLTGEMRRGILWLAAGLFLGALVRPHVVGILGVSLAFAYVLRRPSARWRELAPVAKVLSLAVLSIVTIVLVIRTDAFLRRAGIQTSGGLNSVLQQTAQMTSRGGSQFAPSILDSPARAPLAIASVLFRPFITEAHSPFVAAAAVETTFLLVLTLVRLRWIGTAIRSLRRQPYVALAGVYAGTFILAFSSFANLGLLVRERVQLLPFFLVLICIKPPQPSPAEKSASR